MWLGRARSRAAAEPPVFVGVDIGTQSLKVVVTDGALVSKGTARRPYSPSFPQPGWAEQDPGEWERALAAAIAEALAAAGAHPADVRGLGICGQLDGCLAVDDAGRALGPCLLWMDRRATAETADIPNDLVRRKTGIMVDAGRKIRSDGCLLVPIPILTAGRL